MSRDATNSSRPETWAPRIVVAAISLYVLAYSFATISRHAGLNSSGMDLAMQAQVLWNTAHGRFFQTSIEVRSFLADHVSLVPVLLAPLFWIPGDGVIWLLVFQAAALGSSAWPLYRLTQLETKSPFWWVAVPIAFLLYPVLGFANRFDFHVLVFSIPCLVWMLLFLHQRRFLLASVAAFLAVACREEIGLTVFAVALLMLYQRHRGTQIWGAVVAPLALSWSLLALMWIIPHFRGGPSDTIMRYQWLGDTPLRILLSLLTRPQDVIAHVIQSPIRTQTVFFLLWPLALLPLLAPLRLICGLVPLAVCLLTDHPSTNSIYFHYLSPVVVLIWWAAIGGAARIEGWLARIPQHRVASYAAPSGLILCCSFAFYAETPLTRLITRPFWEVRVFPARPNVREFHEAASMIAPHDSVHCTMAFAPHLSLRRKLTIIGMPTTSAADVVLADVSDFRWFVSPDRLVFVFSDFLQNTGYGIQYWKNGVVLLRRGANHQYNPQDVIDTLQRNGRTAVLRLE